MGKFGHRLETDSLGWETCAAGFSCEGVGFHPVPAII
jgi:hypothetical protein